MPTVQTVGHWLRTHIETKGANECWPATGGGYNKKGWHVSFKASGTRHMAHRAAWIAENGPIPGKLFVLHRCDNPKCCNPRHLFLGTQADNARDMWAKGRGNAVGVLPGTKTGPSPFRRLTAETLTWAVGEYSQGATQKNIAAALGTTDVALGFAFRGKTYPELQYLTRPIQHLLGRGNKNRISNANSNS